MFRSFEAIGPRYLTRGMVNPTKTAFPQSIRRNSDPLLDDCEVRYSVLGQGMAQLSPPAIFLNAVGGWEIQSTDFRIAVMSNSNDKDRVTELPIHPARTRNAHKTPVPEGKLELVVTFLEMTRRPTRAHASHPTGKLTLLRAENPTASFYRYLYNTVGEQWLWYERRKMDDEALGAIIRDSKVRVYVLYVGGVPAGYAELDRRVEGEVELAYFGLMPEFIGRGYGHYFLDWSVDKAWSAEPKRVWVHTCNLDHPKAIAVYQQSGFVPYQQETKFVDDPRLDGTMEGGKG